MAVAIITEKDHDGRPKTIRCSGLLTPELEERAKLLDTYLAKRVPEIEQELVREGLLLDEVPSEEGTQAKGDVVLWHTLGTKLREVCDHAGLQMRREMRWLWEAINNIYASPRIKRAARGKTRNHFEYCYRLSQFPMESAKQVNWSEWVYFFDSRTVREEPRVDAWLSSIVGRGERLDRRIFRRFAEKLNQRVRGMDTSVLSQDELFSMYDTIWTETKLAINSA